MESNENLKHEVKSYWNVASCGTEFIEAKKFSSDYFDKVETFRYSIEPEIFSFAQFTRFRGKKILEVGVGAGTDFTQWVRTGALAYGIDLTEEAIENVQARLALEELQAHDLRTGDAESLPYQDNSFDLAYSWGVIHHSPNTEKCLAELVRVTKPGGIIKCMIYNRRSLFAFYQYLLSGLLKGRPFQSISNVLYHHQESPGTKAFTQKEARAMCAKLPVTIQTLSAPASSHDLLYYKKSRLVKLCARLLASLSGWQTCGWFMMIELKKN